MIYLNYAALCPTHPEAEREVEGTLAEFKQYLYSDAGIQWYLQKSQRCREKVAKLLNVEDPSRIAFVPNASTANFLVLSSLVWNPGDAIVTSTGMCPTAWAPSMMKRISFSRAIRANSGRGNTLPSTWDTWLRTMAFTFWVAVSRSMAVTNSEAEVGLTV